MTTTTTTTTTGELKTHLMQTAWSTFRRRPSQKVFGVSLNRSHIVVPLIMTKCIEYLDKDLDVEGIFRMSGNYTVIQNLKARFDRGENVNLNEVKNPHCVAGLLKQYLREMPEPLCTFELYDCFIAAVGVPDKIARIPKIHSVLGMLPTSHKVVLKVLVSFLTRLSQHVEKNKMTPPNIAIVFAPNVLRAKNESMEDIVTDTPLSNLLLELMIKNYSKLLKDLPDPPEEVPLGYLHDSSVTTGEGTTFDKAGAMASASMEALTIKSTKVFSNLKQNLLKKTDHTVQAPHEIKVIDATHEVHVSARDLPLLDPVTYASSHKTNGSTNMGNTHLKGERTAPTHFHKIVHKPTRPKSPSSTASPNSPPGRVAIRIRKFSGMNNVGPCKQTVVTLGPTKIQNTTCATINNGGSKNGQCPRCNEPIHHTSSFCMKCGMRNNNRIRSVSQPDSEMTSRSSREGEKPLSVKERMKLFTSSGV